MIERGAAYNIDFERDRSSVYRKRQIETHIGERLNALLSQTIYDVRNGKIFGEGETEPFLDVMKSGVGHGKPQDLEREEAELVGFAKIEKILGDLRTLDETMMVSISPKGKDGSNYQHNFYDVFTKRGNQIEARRYSAGLSWTEFGDLAKQLGFAKQVDDVSFLANPIEVKDENLKTPDSVHGYFHKEHGYLSEEDFNLILKVCLPFVLSYADNPSGVSFNAALNIADQAMRNFPEIKSGKLIYLNKVTNSIILEWGKLPVRKTMTGCGSSGGASIESKPFSVSDLAEDKYGSRKFDCPDCGRVNIRPKDQLIPKCQKCGSSKVAC